MACLRNPDIIEKVQIADHERGQIGAQHHGQLREQVGDHQAADQKPQQAHVLVHDHLVQNVLNDDGRRDPEYLNDEGGNEQLRENRLVGPQIADEADPRRLLCLRPAPAPCPG